MELELKKSDIYAFGHTMFEENGSLSICFDADDDSFGVSKILLRNVLKLFGDDYKVTEILDWWSEETDDDLPDQIVVRTNLPWDVLMATEQEL